MTAEYETNLANFIRDIRQDLGVPNLLVAIGVFGMTGYDKQPKPQNIRNFPVPLRRSKPNILQENRGHILPERRDTIGAKIARATGWLARLWGKQWSGCSYNNNQN